MRLAALAIGFTLLAAPALAQSPNQPMNGGITAEDFARAVATSDMFEIAVSKLAQTRGTAGEKAFAQQMIHDHTQTSTELKNLIAREKLGVALPTGLDKQQHGELRSLGALKGRKFSARFDTLQVKAHQDAITLFENYAQSGEDAGLKDWATKTLPTLQHHLQMAQGLSS